MITIKVNKRSQFREKTMRHQSSADNCRVVSFRFVYIAIPLDRRT